MRVLGSWWAGYLPSKTSDCSLTRRKNSHWVQKNKNKRGSGVVYEEVEKQGQGTATGLIDVCLFQLSGVHKYCGQPIGGEQDRSLDSQ